MDVFERDLEVGGRRENDWSENEVSYFHEDIHFVLFVITVSLKCIPPSGTDSH